MLPLTGSKRFAYLYVLICLIALGILVASAIPFNLIISVYEGILQPGRKISFASMNYYIEILSDPIFHKAFVDSLIFTLSTDIGALLLGLLTALLCNAITKGRATVRGIVLLPYIVPLISVAYAWRFMFHPVSGVMNYFLMEILHVIKQPVNWVMDPKYAMTAVIIFDIWRYFPFSYLIILAALQSIDKALYEAAEIDGANKLQRFFYITLPQLRFVLAAVFLIRFIWNINKFDDVYLLTAGVVTTVPVYAYKTAFTSYDYTRGAAINLIMAGFTFVILIIYIRRVLKW
jgi:multiple sugar transport system permease protein